MYIIFDTQNGIIRGRRQLKCEAEAFANHHLPMRMRPQIKIERVNAAKFDEWYTLMLLRYRK